MITDVGRTVACVKTADGTVLNIFNRTFYNWGTNIVFKDERGNNRYNVIVDTSYVTNCYRCACFTRSFATRAIDNSPQILLYVPTSAQSSAFGITAQPLFELISPTIAKNEDIYQLTWWSNVEDYSQMAQGSGGTYEYDPSKLKMFSTNTLGDEAENSSCAKILCTAMMNFERLVQVGGSSKDASPRWTPVIRNVAVIAVITGEGYITDFSTGGSGGGIGMHSHLSNDDAGFAAAVFMPSAVMKPFNWS